MITVAKNSGIILYFIIVTAPIQNIIVCIWPGKDIHRRSALRAALIPQQDSLRSAVTELRLIHAHAQNINNNETSETRTIVNFEISKNKATLGRSRCLLIAVNRRHNN